NGSTPKVLFVDPRLARLATYDLGGFTDGPLPGALAVYLMPTHGTNILSLAESHDPTVPVNLEAITFSGEPLIDPQSATTLAPDLLGQRGVDPTTGNDIAYVATGGQTTDGAWGIVPTQVGPFPASGETPSRVDVDTALTAQAFDGQAVSSSGDLMAIFAGQADPNSFNPLVLAPGQSGVINVTITPTAAVGTTVSGTLYVAAYNDIPLSTDELAALPYTYTVN
ncbi:MAG TPA: hypothetical protein VHB98_13700, partial [Chloroflexota bacterium]|nr:hypothetical protein [Chloroflexota bacterium]